MSLKSITAGKHTLVEIPIAMNLEGAEAVVTAAREKGLFLGVSHPMRYRAERHDMVRRVAEGQEKIHSVQGRFFIHRLQNVGATGLQRSWTDNILWHHTTHLVDIGLWTVAGGDMATVEDRIRNVYAAYPAVEPRTGIPMELVLVVETHDDQTILCNGSYYAHNRIYDVLHVTDRDDYHVDELTSLMTTADGRAADPDRAGERRADRAGVRRGRAGRARAVRAGLVGAARHAGPAPGPGAVGRQARQAAHPRPAGHLKRPLRTRLRD